LVGNEIQTPSLIRRGWLEAFFALPDCFSTPLWPLLQC
jgi:hypothetical protein